MTVRAILFDLNGTLSHDEHLWAAVYAEVFAAHGRPITPDEYAAELAGLSDEDAVRRWFGPEEERAEALVAETVERFVQLAREHPTVPPDAVAAVAAAAEAVPVGVVTTATRALVEPLVTTSGLDRLVRFVVTAEDVERTKPHPDPYLRALELLPGIAAGDVLVFEDTPVGTAAAVAAGMRCVGVLGTVPAALLAEADAVVDRLDAACVRRFMGAA